ncbi:MAG TPA: pirin family protein [Usitatibacter sp.]|nr:pirin family protein [Usitatibacter sp.]
MNATVLDGTAVRPVAHLSVAQVAPVGTFTVKRALPFRERHSVGPWVFLDHFGPMRVKPGEDGVGAHPHAGIETVTYLLSGRNEHRDSAGHTGVVSAGGVQWMTAGGGIIHAEHPLAENEAELTMHGIQLWTSLPRLMKTMAPRYQRIDAAAIPAVEAKGVRVRVIAGEYRGTAGPAQTLMPTFLWHATVAPGATFEAQLRDGFEAGAYVISGEARIAGTPAGAGNLAVLSGEGEVRVENAGTAPLEVLLLGGAPAEGPLVFHGPFVMNSVEQVRAAEVAYRTGRMGSLTED